MYINKGIVNVDLSMSFNDYLWMTKYSGPLRHEILRVSQGPMVFEQQLCIQRLALERWQADSGIRPSASATNIWLVIRSGICLLRINGQEHAARAGQLIAIPVGQDYQLWIGPDEDCEHYIFNADGDVVKRWWASIGGERAQVAQLHKLNKIELISDMLIEHLMADDSNERWTAGLLFQSWLSMLSVDITKAVQEQPCASTRHAEAARQYIDDNVHTLNHISEIASFCGVHPDYLRRCFHARFQEGLARYVRRRKMDVACKMLSEGNASLAEIADEIGFSDAFTFSKSFKQIVGLAPSAWRQQFQLSISE